MPDHKIYQWATDDGIKTIVVNQYGGETVCTPIHFLPLDGYIRLTLTYVENEYNPGPGGLGID